MTPAEKPSDRERNDVLVRLAKKAMALPMPVDIPANSVRRNGTNTCCDMAMTDWELVLQKRTKIYFVQKQSESLFAGDSLDTMNYYF